MIRFAKTAIRGGLDKSPLVKRFLWCYEYCWAEPLAGANVFGMPRRRVSAGPDLAGASALGWRTQVQRTPLFRVAPFSNSGEPGLLPALPAFAPGTVRSSGASSRASDAHGTPCTSAAPACSHFSRSYDTACGSRRRASRIWPPAWCDTWCRSASFYPICFIVSSACLFRNGHGKQVNSRERSVH